MNMLEFVIGLAGVIAWPIALCVIVHMIMNTYKGDKNE